MALRWFFGMILVVLCGVVVSYAQERFDNAVRDDMFRGFAGNEAALKNALATIDAKLQEDPNNAQALVWRGAARSFQAGQAFRAGDIARGRELAAGGMSDMDRAVSLEPGTIGVLIPRASTLLAAARFQPDPVRARDLASRAAADFEAALAIRQGVFDKLPQHNRGEYLSGLAESWALAGDKAAAERYLQRIVSELPNTRYADRAAAKLADWNDHGALNCQSCH
jgi:tetratricopeptide (TPR) repeat protein